MKRAVFLTIILVGLLALVGCQTRGFTVQDNTYPSLAGQTIKVVDDFTYVGYVDPSVMTSAEGAKMKVDPMVRTRADVFVRSQDGKVLETVIIERSRLTNVRWTWNAMEGKKAEFGGVKFKENYFIARQGDDITIDSYIDFISQNNYEFSSNEYFCRRLKRHHGERVLVSINYAISPTGLPDSIVNDADLAKAYVSLRFEEVLKAL